MTISRYTPDKRQQWDEFVTSSKNGTMLFMRDYMDYHADRFHDHSLMCYNEDGKLMAVLPANEADGALWSHQGLTYGGFILSPLLHSPALGKIFVALHQYMHNNGIHILHYKPVPSIYHRMPSEEDEYWLWRYRAVMEGCNISSAVNLAVDKIYCSKSRRTNSNKLMRMGYSINAEARLADFWPVLTNNLMDTYGAQPVHTLEEMQRLQASFPDNIVCWTVSSPEGEVLGGTVLYLTNDVVHTQYISATERGKDEKVIDYLFMVAINHYKEQGRHRYFDFGTSNARNGLYLQDNLILQKEGFGGRGITYKYYRLDIRL